MEEFKERRIAEMKLLEMLTQTEEASLDKENNRIYVQPIVLEEETEEDREIFLTTLIRTGHPLRDDFFKLVQNNTYFTTRIDFKSYYGYQNVLKYDELFFQGIPGYSTYLLATDGGWIWLFWNETSPFLGMIGIRVSVVVFLQRVRGTASKMVKRVLEYAQATDKTHIVVPNPLWGMRKILSDNGFERIEEAGDTYEKKFIAAVEPSDVYYKYTIPRGQ